MTTRSLLDQNHPVQFDWLTPVGTAMALASKNKGSRAVIRPKTHRYSGCDGKKDYLMLVLFNQTSASTPKIGRLNNQMPIARQPS
jgi:hypothetical protein